MLGSRGSFENRMNPAAIVLYSHLCLSSSGGRGSRSVDSVTAGVAGEVGWKARGAARAGRGARGDADAERQGCRAGGARGDADTERHPETKKAPVKRSLA